MERDCSGLPEGAGGEVKTQTDQSLIRKSGNLFSLLSENLMSVVIINNKVLIFDIYLLTTSGMRFDKRSTGSGTN
jgi:hypothetical protein